MIVTLRDIFEAKDALDRVLSAPLEAEAAYRMHKLARIVLTELQDLEQARLGLVEKYADPQTEPDGSRRVRARLAEFSVEFEKLLAVEVEISVPLIPLDCLKGLTVSAYDLARLEKFVEAGGDAPMP